MEPADVRTLAQGIYGMKENGKIWIAWEYDGSIRSKVLSKEMKSPFFTFTRFEGAKKPMVFLRYPVAMVQTFFTLAKEKPGVLVVQNPSIVLSFFSALVKPLFNYRLVIDLHTLYLHPSGFKKLIMQFLNDYSLKRGDIVIVTNESYKVRIKEKTGREIFVLPDHIPDFEYEFEKMALRGKTMSYSYAHFQKMSRGKKSFRQPNCWIRRPVFTFQGKTG